MLIKQSHMDINWPKLQHQLEQQFEQTSKSQKKINTHSRKKKNHHQSPKNNILIRFTTSLKNYTQNLISFFMTILFLIPLWFFKIFLRFLDLIQKLIRLYIWAMVKSFISLLNLTYKILKFFKIQKPVDFLDSMVNKYIKKYLLIGQEQYNEQKQKKSNQLINMKKLQKKIKTPNIFISHSQQQQSFKINNQKLSKQQKQFYKQKINQDLIPQRQVTGNIVQSNTKMKSPRIFNSPPQSPSKYRRNYTTSTIQNQGGKTLMFSSLKLQQTQPFGVYQEYEEYNIKDQSIDEKKKEKNKRIQAEKDVIIQQRQKQHMLSPQPQLLFKKKCSPQKQILMTPHLSFPSHIPTTQSQQKSHLQNQISSLRQKMSSLIFSNNRDIQQLQDWIHQKTQTTTMTRYQNLQLLQQIQSLQHENIQKTRSFIQLQHKIKLLQENLNKQLQQKSKLNSQLQTLQEQVKTKTIEIMGLRQKIKRNFQHVQLMTNMFNSSDRKEQSNIEIIGEQMEEPVYDVIIMDSMKNVQKKAVSQPQPQSQIFIDQYNNFKQKSQQQQQYHNLQAQILSTQPHSVQFNQPKSQSQYFNKNLTNFINNNNNNNKNSQKQYIDSNIDQRGSQPQMSDLYYDEYDKQQQLKKQRQQQKQQQNDYDINEFQISIGNQQSKQLHKKKQEKIKYVNPLQEIEKEQGNQIKLINQNQEKIKKQQQIKIKQQKQKSLKPQQKLQPLLQNVQKDKQVQQIIRKKHQQQKKQQQKPIFLQQKNKKKNKKKHHQIK